MKIRITTLIFHDEDGINDVIHSLQDSDELAKQELVDIYNKENLTNFKTLEEIQSHETNLTTGAGAYLTIQELTLTGPAWTAIIKS